MCVPLSIYRQPRAGFGGWLAAAAVVVRRNARGKAPITTRRLGTGKARQGTGKHMQKRYLEFWATNPIFHPPSSSSPRLAGHSQNPIATPPRLGKEDYTYQGALFFLASLVHSLTHSTALSLSSRLLPSRLSSVSPASPLSQLVITPPSSHSTPLHSIHPLT
ncbi:hypothetical protein BKA80DRAFT_284413 [Phyllosticta citrichinensis]